MLVINAVFSKAQQCYRRHGMLMMTFKNILAT